MKPGQQLKRFFIHDWEAKLVALVLAFLLWYVVKDQVIRSRFKMPSDYPATRTAGA
jgi:hypothetical protein